jgi:hypothetical protein
MKLLDKIAHNLQPLLVERFFVVSGGEKLNGVTAMYLIYNSSHNLVKKVRVVC